MTKPTTTNTRPSVARGGQRHGALPAVLAAGLLLAGCGGKANGLDLQTPAPEVSRSITPVEVSPTPLPTTAPSPSPSPSTPASTAPAQTEQQKVVAGYEAYYDLLHPLAEMPDEQRPAALASVAGDPLYSAVLTEFAKRDAAGKTGYGRIVTHPQVELLRGDSAAVRDCQDSTNAGLMSRTTGERLTVGVPAYLRLSDMKRGTDGVWRLTAINDYPKAKC